MTIFITDCPFVTQKKIKTQRAINHEIEFLRIIHSFQIVTADKLKGFISAIPVKKVQPL